MGVKAENLIESLALINCSVSSLNAISSQLMLEQIARTYALSDPVNNEDANAEPCSLVDLTRWLQIADGVCLEFEIGAGRARIRNMMRRIDKGITNRELAVELRVLRETIDDGLKGQLVYRYEDRQRLTFSNWKRDWQTVLNAFPSATVDIRSGVDLWALHYSTASVFHMMRVLETGLKILAADVGKAFTVQNWQNIIEQIEAEIKIAGKSLPQSAGKSERLRFLSAAAKEFMYFKDGWRNYVSHNRSAYTDDEAESVMVHVRQFMATLAERLSEGTQHPDPSAAGP